MGGERDWSTLRSGNGGYAKDSPKSSGYNKQAPKGRWVPVKNPSSPSASSSSAPAPASSKADAEDVPPGFQDVTEPKAKKGFATDVEISESREEKEKGKNSSARELQRWDDSCGKEVSSELVDCSLEDLPRHESQRGNFDQFKVNYELFGYVSTFKSDLSQYTTTLDKKSMSLEQRRKAEEIAKSIESGSKSADVDDAAYLNGKDCDEEALFSSVPREGASRANEDSNAGGGLLLSALRAGAGTARPESDYRSVLAPLLQDWWAARQTAGAEIPEGADTGLVCPFTEHVFGDVNQLVMHWVTALIEIEEKNPSREQGSMSYASGQFRQAASKLRWSSLSSVSGLNESCPTEKPREGSVWQKVLERLQKKQCSDQPVPFDDWPVLDFIVAVLAIKCWRRDQKVEHRAVLEGIAAGLAIHILREGASGKAAGKDLGVQESAVGVCH
mmetsp:Transcript_10865/g.19334  ORF Transcript_10865/g.19334 Transcript_10865/m.19334 type:complete len:444 (+) Transcript_10865:16-1347(+)